MNTHQQLQQNAESGLGYVVNWVLRLIPAVIVGQAAWMKFTDDPKVSMMFTSLEMEPGGRLLIGFIEALCVVLLLSPRISAWGAILCLGVMIGAVIAHVTVLGFDGSFGSLFAMALASAVASMAIIYRMRRQVPFISSMFDR